MLYGVLSAVIVVAAVILVGLVLVQNSKGGGFASGFSAPNQIMGVRQATNFVEKATWGFAGFIVLLSIVVSISISSTEDVVVEGSAIKGEVENAMKEQASQNAVEFPAMETPATTEEVAE